MLPTWTFDREGERLIVQRDARDGSSCALIVTRDGLSRTIDFPELPALVRFQTDMDTFLLRTGWLLLNYAPDRRRRDLAPLSAPEQRSPTLVDRRCRAGGRSVRQAAARARGKVSASSDEVARAPRGRLPRGPTETVEGHPGSPAGPEKPSPAPAK